MTNDRFAEVDSLYLQCYRLHYIILYSAIHFTQYYVTLFTNQSQHYRIIEIARGEHVFRNASSYCIFMGCIYQDLNFRLRFRLEVNTVPT